MPNSQLPLSDTCDQMSAQPSSQVSSFNLSAFLAQLPESSGCYLMHHASGQVIYVGKAKNLKRRVSSYFQRESDHPKTRALVSQIAYIETILTRTETEAFILEYTLIKKHNPKYNIIFRDDKSYPYLYFSTQQAFPGLYFYRGSRQKEGRLFGPFPSAPAVYDTLQTLQKLFPVRQCQDTEFRNRSRPCLQYQIKRCSAPCVGLVSQTDYAKAVNETLAFLEGKSQWVIQQKTQEMLEASEQLAFEQAAQLRDQIARLTSIQAKQFVSSDQPEDVDVIVVLQDEITQQVIVQLMMIRAGNVWGSSNHYPKHAESHALSLVLSAFILQYYTGREIPKRILTNLIPEDDQGLLGWLADQAGRRIYVSQPKRGQGNHWIKMCQENALQALKTTQLLVEQGQALMLQLQARFSLPRVPARIECFDISHFYGTDTVASQVVFIHGIAQQKLYRRFNIQGITGADDFAAMHQVLSRRLLRGKKEGVLPDLIIVDGGRGQLKQAEQVVATLEVGQQVMLMAMAKGEGRKSGLETFYLQANGEGCSLASDDPVAHLLQRIRDEAHRFALKSQRHKRRLRSKLNAKD